MVAVELILIAAVLLYLLYKWSTQTYDTFTQRGLPHKKPWPLIGNAWPFLENKQSLHKIMLNLYRETKQHKIYGFYNFREPFFIVQDPELVKLIGVKDFDSFANHQQMGNLEKDPIMGGMLTVMKDQRWKEMRNTISPIFTGAKMRTMFTLMNECFAESMKHLHSHVGVEGEKEGVSKSFDIELKDCFARLSNDLIATTAFGLKVNSYVDKDNEFFRIGMSFTKFRARQAMKFMLINIAPKLCELLGVQLFDRNQNEYFLRLVVDTMKYRQTHNIVRPDMINQLMEAQKESAQHWTNEELVAQCFIFFFAAFENNANLLCTTCYELMDNPHIQERLYEEICEVKQELSGKTLDYDVLQRMRYLDMVVSESLRKWTLGALTDRNCGKEYTVRDEEGKVVVQLKPGDRVWFHTIGLHWDEQYFEHPEVFDPERFSEENKHKIKPFTYFPFGVGPRICIGNRYALMQAKAMLYYLLLDFKIKRCEKTCANLMDDLRGFQIAPKSGFWFKLERRSHATEQ